MKKNISLLLLQARKKNDLMIKNELDCFSKSLKIEKKQFTIRDLTREKVKKSEIRKHDLILVGGSGDYSIAKGGDFMKQTMDIMQYLVSFSKKTFASCWGFQAMAKARGGEVVRDLHEAELGTTELFLTNEGKKDNIFQHLPDIFLAQMGHEDIVKRLPSDAILLASSKQVKNEAFTFKNKPIYCTQFHPELNKNDLKQRMKRYPEYVKKILGISENEFINTRCQDSKDTNKLLLKFIEEYIN